MQRPNGYDFMRQQGAAVRQGPQNYAGVSTMQAPQQARPAWSGANPVAARPQIGAGPVRQPQPTVTWGAPPAPQQAQRENRAWGAAQAGQGNVYLGNPAPAGPPPGAGFTALPPSYTAQPHATGSRPGLPLPGMSSRPGGTGGYIPFNPAPPQNHGPGYVPGASTVMPTFGAKASAGAPFVPQGPSGVGLTGTSGVGLAGPPVPEGGVSGLMSRRVDTTPSTDRGQLQMSVDRRTMWDDVADQLGLSGQGATNGNDVNASQTGTSAAQEQRDPQSGQTNAAGQAPPTEGAPSPLMAGITSISPWLSDAFGRVIGATDRADGSGPLGEAAGTLTGILGDPVIGAAKKMNEGERGVMRDYYDQFRDLDPSKRFGESMLDPGVQAAQEQAAREGMRSEIDRQRDAALRMGAAQAARGGRQSSGWDQGIYGEALRNTQQGERDLVMDAFKRRLSAGQLGSSVLSDRANTIYGAMQPGYTSPKELAAMIMTALPDLADAIIPG